MVIAIDLGSNSARICQMDTDYQIISSKQFMVGSALDLKKTGNLTQQAQDRIIAALKEFKKEFNFDLPYRAVATEAFRVAKNSNEFFKRVKEIVDINFEIISADEEARLMSIAVEQRLKALNLFKSDSLYIDLGGASTEISYKNEFISFKFGIVEFYQKISNFFEIKNEDELIQIYEKALDESKKAREFLSRLNFSQIVLTSGAPTTVVAVKKNITYNAYEARVINGEILSYDDLNFVLKKILKFSKDELNLYFGFDRAYLIAAGINLLLALLKDCKSKKMIVVDDGLREGVAIDLLQKILIDKISI